MKKSIAAIATATVIAFAAVPAQAGGFSSLKSLDSGAETSSQLVHKTGKKSRKIARGIFLGLAVAGALAAHNHYYYESRHERRCRRWERRCYNGNDNACWKLDTRC